VHGTCPKYPGVIANEKRLCLLDGYRGGQGLSSTWVVLPLTGDLELQVCKSHQKSIIIVVIIIIIIIVVVIIIIIITTTTTIIIIIISSSSSSTHGGDNEWRQPRGHPQQQHLW